MILIISIKERLSKSKYVVYFKTMEVIFLLLVILIGFAALIKGAEWLVEGASSLAHKLGVSNLVIGLTIVSFGTSAPELLVSMVAAISGNADIALGNVVGSNISNIFLILGVTAIAAAAPLTIRHGTVWKEIPLTLLAIVLLFVFANDGFIEGAASSFIGRTEGIALLAFFIIFIYYTFGLEKPEGEIDGRIKFDSTPMALAWVFIGLITLVIGGKLSVESASQLATVLGISEAFIAVTIVALGTSLPELVTSVVAAKKGKVDLAVGNVVGSNLFNVFFVIGLTATVSPINFNPALQTDILVAIFASLLLFFAMFYGKRLKIGKFKGTQLLIFYIAYILFVTFRG